MRESFYLSTDQSVISAFSVDARCFHAHRPCTLQPNKMWKFQMNFSATERIKDPRKFHNILYDLRRVFVPIAEFHSELPCRW